MSLGTIMVPGLYGIVIATDLGVGALAGYGVYHVAKKRVPKPAALLAAAAVGFLGAEGFHKVVWSGRI